MIVSYAFHIGCCLMCLLSLLYECNTSRHTNETVEECHLDSMYIKTVVLCYCHLWRPVCFRIFGKGGKIGKSLKDSTHFNSRNYWHLLTVYWIDTFFLLDCIIPLALQHKGGGFKTCYSEFLFPYADHAECDWLSQMSSLDKTLARTTQEAFLRLSWSLFIPRFQHRWRLLPNFPRLWQPIET